MVPAPHASAGDRRQLVAIAEALPERVDAALAHFAPHEALAAIWELVGAANKYVSRRGTLDAGEAAQERGARPAEARLATTLYHLVEALRLIAWHVRPFLPTTADEIEKQLGLQEVDAPADATVWGAYPAGARLAGGAVLFPKFELPEAPIVQES